MIEQESVSIGKSMRKDSFNKLKHFLLNPGRFSVLVVGGRGTGKRTAIQHCYRLAHETATGLDDATRKALCFLAEAPLFMEPKGIPLSEDELDGLLKEWHEKTVVILNVDELTHLQQLLLFKAMSTDNGRFGLRSKDYGIRMIFTSSKPVNLLREEGKFLIGIFWDRISQLVVELPDYQKDSRTVLDDFRYTWAKMKFSNFKEIGRLSDFPRNAILQGFLEEKASEFSGGFRDLDKIAVLYFSYRLLYYGEVRKVFDEKEDVVARSTRVDFWSLQLQSESDDALVNFKMDSKPSWTELHKAFKIQFRDWARKKYGSLGAVEKKLGIPYDTLKDFTERGQNRLLNKGS